MTGLGAVVRTRLDQEEHDAAADRVREKVREHRRSCPPVNELELTSTLDQVDVRRFRTILGAECECGWSYSLRSRSCIRLEIGPVRRV